MTRCSVLLALKTTDTLLLVCFYTCHTNISTYMSYCVLITRYLTFMSRPSEHFAAGNWAGDRTRSTETRCFQTQSWWFQGLNLNTPQTQRCHNNQFKLQHNSGNIHLFSWSNIHSILTIKCKVWPFLPVSGSQEIITTHYSNIKKEYHLFCTFCTLCSSLPQTVRRLMPSTVRTHFLKLEEKPNMNRSWNILSRINVKKCILMYIWTRWMIYVRAKWYQNVPSRTDYKVGWEENECFTLYKNRWSKCAASPDWSHTC